MQKEYREKEELAKEMETQVQLHTSHDRHEKNAHEHFTKQK
jgi:hypothetical protein